VNSLALAGGCGAFGVGCMAFLPAHQPIARALNVENPNHVEASIIVVSTIFVGISALLFSTFIFKLALKYYKENFQKTDRFSIRESRHSDLEYVDKQSTKWFGAVASDRRSIDKIFNNDSSQIWIIEKTEFNNDKGHRITTRVGYIILFRLNKYGVESIKNNEFNGSCPSREHLCRKGDVCNAIYIGAVVARFRARPYLLGVLENQLTLSKKYNSAKTIYARAATNDGLRALKTHDFEPLTPADTGVGSIFCLERSHSSRAP